MGTTEIVIIIVVAILAVVVLSKIAKTIFKVALIILVVLVAYLIWSGKSFSEAFQPGLESIFAKHSIADLKERHCSGTKAEKTLCQCVLESVDDDLKSRFSPGKLNNLLEEDRKTYYKEAIQSYRNQKGVITTCLKERKSSGPQIFSKLKEFYEKVK